MTQDRLTGLATLALAIAFNIPFSMLASQFDYPDILRQPSGVVLDRFAAGGPSLVLTWYAFMMVALVLAPVGVALAMRMALGVQASVLRGMAMTMAGLAGLAQAIGLARWVFAVPGLAALHADPASKPDVKAMTEVAFRIMHEWGGVGIGEHLGQFLTVGFILSVALLQKADERRVMRWLVWPGLVSAALIFAGLADSILLALGATETAFAILTVFGYLALTVWMVLTGLVLLIQPRSAGLA